MELSKHHLLSIIFNNALKNSFLRCQRRPQKWSCRASHPVCVKYGASQDSSCIFVVESRNSFITMADGHLPNFSRLCHADLFTGSILPRHRLLSIHVWGCPTYVLDPKLQAGGKFPRWQPRSRQGIIMGFSHLDLNKVLLILPEV